MSTGDAVPARSGALRAEPDKLSRAKPPAAIAWRPIDTAPKATDDYGISPTVLLYVPEGHGLDQPAVTIGSYFREEVRDEDGRFRGGEWTAIDWDYMRTPYVRPTHWMPLPTAPEGV